MVTNNAINIVTGALNTILMGQGVGVSSAFSTATYPATTNANRILFSTADNSIGQIASAANGLMITNGSSVPAIGNTLAANFTCQIATGATPIAIQVSSTDNSSTASDAFFYAAGGGTSGGSAYTRYTNLTRYWAVGVKGSDGTFKINTDTTGVSPTTGTNVLSISTAGIFNLVNNLVANTGTAATPIAIQVSSTDNTSTSSDAFFYAASGGASGGSAYSRYTNLVRYWSAGVKASDGTYRITSDSTGNSPATGTTVVNISTAGSVTMPLTPAFSAYLNSPVLNVSGDGTTYTLGSGGALLTEIFDQQNNFNTNGTLTSPVTGIYDLKSGAYWNGLTIATIFYNQIVTSNRSYTRIFVKAAGIQDESILNQALADMDAGDTATVIVSVNGEAGKTADLYGVADNPYTYFQGSLQM